MDEPIEQQPDVAPPAPKSPLELAAILAQYEDEESAILVYKEAASIMAEYNKVKQQCVQMVEASLIASGKTKLVLDVGTAGWSAPKKKKLNEARWLAALEVDTDLAALQGKFHDAEQELERAQEPFMELPEGRFYIR